MKTDMNNVPVVCYGCGHGFTAMRVTASLKCGRCGSSDLDLDDRQPHTAASPGTGWTESRPDPLQGWNDYVGPTPGPNPNSSKKLVSEDLTCQACGGTGVDNRASGGGYNEVPCRNCHGTGIQAGHSTPPGSPNDGTTSRAPAGSAQWSKGAGRRSSDPLGSADDYIRGTDPDYDNRSGEPRKADSRAPEVAYRGHHPYTHSNGPLALKGAHCPHCLSNEGIGVGTQLVRDAHDDAWWHCPNCGPLANIDQNPSINPFDPEGSFVPDRRMKTKMARFRKQRKTGKALKMTRQVLTTNPGLSTSQALTLVRNALLKYPEGE